MLRSDAIYNSLFRFRNIDLNNVNDIYFAINIIIVITTTLFETFIVIVFVFEFIIVIIINVDIIVIIVILEEFIIKLIVLDFDIKRRFTMSALFDKS